jgi:predicted permease
VIAFRRLYRALILLTPREFRERHGRDAITTACRRVVEERGARRTFRAGREIADLALAIPSIWRNTGPSLRAPFPHQRTSIMNAITVEARQAFRALRRSKTTTAVAVLALGLAMGMSTAVFSVADRVLFRPLPYPAPDRLVELSFTTPIFSVSVSGAELAAARAATNVFEQVEAYRLGESATRTDGPEPERLRVGRVTPGFLRMLGARVVGEGFGAADAAGDGAAVAILSHEYWRTRMGADPRAIGSLMRVDGEPPLRIVGVLDRAFSFPTTRRAALPEMLRPIPDNILAGRSRYATPIGRLRGGVAPAAVPAAVPVDPAISERARADAAITAEPLSEVLVYKAKRGLSILFASVVALLAVGIVDVAGLLVVQAGGREREIVTRRALGASTGRIARQLLLEGFFVAAASGTVGLFVAILGFEGLMRAVPPDLQVLHATGIDGRALAFSAGVALVTALVCGLAPLLHLGRVSSTAFRTGTAQTPGRTVRRLSSALVSAQIAGAVALAVMGALLVASFLGVINTPLGFDADRLTYVSVSPSRDGTTRLTEFYDEALRRIRSIPGVESAALMDLSPLRSEIRGTVYAPEGRQIPEGPRRLTDTQLVVTPDYFRTAGLEILEGRAFAPEDGPNAGTLAIVNETLTKWWFAGESPVGQRLTSPVGTRTIIGVVEDARHFALKEEPAAEIFLPMDPGRPMRGGTFVVRAADPAAAIAPVAAALRSLAPTLTITAVETGAGAIGRAAQAERFYATLLAILTGAGLTLAGIGLYGVLSWSVGSRRRELGLRAALGADRRRLGWAIARQAMPLVGAGALAGALLGSWGARLASALLHEVRPADPAIWVTVGAALAVVCGVAIAGPSLRALRTSPAEALRID